MIKKDQQTDSISDIHSLNVDTDNRIIYLQEREDSSSDSSGVDFRMAQTLIKNINVLQKLSFDPITIYMQTVGGCWFSGLGIYDVIKFCKCKTTIIGYSQICSMGTIIMQAADRRVLMPNCMFMCHYGSSDHSGDYLSSQNFSAVDKKNMQTMIDIYSERCYRTGQFFRRSDRSLSQVKTYIKRKMKDGDWYLSASDAVELGFIDHVFSNSLKI